MNIICFYCLNMACFLTNKHNTGITIPSIQNVGGVTFYVIAVRIGVVVWTVKRRYNDFADLHGKLVADHSVNKDLMPPKKVIGNKEPSFIEKRRVGLEAYLISVVNFLQRRMPRELVLFLDFHLYDVLFLLQEMSIRLFNEGDALLANSKLYNYNPLELHAISERLRQPCPPLEIIDKCHDFSHVLDFCCQLTSIVVEGSADYFGNSNIIANQLGYELSVFKSLQNLALKRARLDSIYDVSSLRESVTSLKVNSSGMTSIGDMLLCDEMHRDLQNDGSVKIWQKLVETDFSKNEICIIDSACKLAPKLERLILNENRIKEIPDLTALTSLTHLYLSANAIKNVDDLHSRLGQIIFIDLSQNEISSLNGFAGLLSLQGLDIGFNTIEQLDEITHINSLPRLEYLTLTGNQVATVVDYRVKVLELFGRRSSAICLDNEKPTQKELDTVAILQALKIVKEGRVPTFGRSLVSTFP